MERKNAKRILFRFKILRNTLAIIGILLIIVPIGLAFYSVIPFFPFIFLLLFFIFIGYPLFIKVVYHKNIFCFSNNDRKSIKYIILPEIIATLVVWIIYWKYSFPLLWFLIIKFINGFTN